MSEPRSMSFKGCKTRAEARERLGKFLDSITEEQVDKMEWQWIVDDGADPDPAFREQIGQLRAEFLRSRAEAFEVLDRVLDQVGAPRSTIEEEIAEAGRDCDERFARSQSEIIAWLRAHGVTNDDDMRQALSYAFDEYERQRSALLEGLRSLLQRREKLQHRIAELEESRSRDSEPEQ